MVNPNSLRPYHTTLVPAAGHTVLRSCVAPTLLESIVSATALRLVDVR